MSDTQKLPDTIRFHNHDQPTLNAGSYGIELPPPMSVFGIANGNATGAAQ